MTPEAKRTVKTRLARIEGQVRAARAALAKIEQIVLQDHLGSCVEAAIVSGDPKEQRAKVAELIDVLGRSDR
jgi:DNA-binding FrmR family transcriptional regulator